MLIGGEPVHGNERTDDEEEDQGIKELDGQNVNQESDEIIEETEEKAGGNQESNENMEETEEEAGVDQLDENPNGEIDENEEVGQNEVDGNEESNETKEEAEVGETDENPDEEIDENEEENRKNEEEDEKERRKRDIKQGKQPMYKEGGPFKDYEGKNEGTEIDFDKWSW
ncbi:DEK domain-containing chromatin-associated protein 4-like [Solanum lycopersicum]|uniref:DEK domain-containing chromatin-associated protein 4-like n=1 Tax=Solanum lycopersicum TaxID=4081 RepID=UPI0037493758